MNPNNENEIFASTSDGVYTTKNAQSSNPTWTKSSNGIPSSEIQLKGLEFQPGDENVLYTSGVDIYESVDHGLNWTSLTKNGSTGLDLSSFPNSFVVNRIDIAVTPANKNIIYAYITGRSSVGGEAYVYKYNKLTNSWVELFYEGERGAFYAKGMGRTAIAASPIRENEVYIGTTMVIGNSYSSASSFKYRSPYYDEGFHADVHGLAFDPFNPDVLFVHGFNGPIVGMLIKYF